MQPEDVTLPPLLAEVSASTWRALSTSTRRFAWTVGLGCAGLATWITFYVLREGRALAPRDEELWPFLGFVTVAALCVRAVKRSRRPEPLRAALAVDGVRVSWVALREVRGPRGRRLFALWLGLTSGARVGVGLASGSGPLEQRRAAARAVEAEALAFFRPAYRGDSAEAEAGFRRRPGG